MEIFKHRISRRAALVGGVTLAAAGLATAQVIELAADPTGEKDCAPLISQAIGKSNDIEFGALLPSATELDWAQQAGFINDASCLNRTPVYGVVRIQSEEDVRTALRFAQEQSLKIAPAGVRHSMGGQAFAANALILDMRSFNRIELDEPNQLITVQSGATWHDIQNLLHPKYAVKAMQSTDIFTVGGSIAVNAHGMDHQVGAIAQTIRSLRIMLADGSVRTVSRSAEPELFRLVVGGYGLFGVILDAVLEVTENVIYETGRRVVTYDAFPALFRDELAANKKLGLMYAHLSTAPQSLLRELILYTYEERDVPDAVIPPLGEVSSVKLRRFVLNFSKTGDWPMRLKWFAEKNIEPRLESCSVTRNQAMKDGEACLVSRNEPMHDSVHYLRNNLRGETDILHEYFIPRENFVAFVDGLRQIVQEQQVNLLNASVRVVHKEDIFLNYAPVDVFSVVLYINQITDVAGEEKMRKVTGELIDLAISLGGRFFLPYQLHYTAAQLEQAYPEIGAFFAAKRQVDPGLRFTNTFYEKYAADVAGAYGPVSPIVTPPYGGG
jgi:FAD/FMN-containing dehydrogenase